MYSFTRKYLKQERKNPQSIKTKAVSLSFQKDPSNTLQTPNENPEFYFSKHLWVWLSTSTTVLPLGGAVSHQDTPLPEISCLECLEQRALLQKKILSL